MKQCNSSSTCRWFTALSCQQPAKVASARLPGRADGQAFRSDVRDTCASNRHVLLAQKSAKNHWISWHCPFNFGNFGTSIFYLLKLNLYLNFTQGWRILDPSRATEIFSVPKRRIFALPKIVRYRNKSGLQYALGFVVLRDVVKVFPVTFSSFARKTIGRNRARSHSGARRGPKTKWDLKLSLPRLTDLIWYLFILVRTTTRSQAQAWRFPALTAPEAEFLVVFGSKWDPLTIDCMAPPGQGGGSPERLAELPTDVSPLQKRILRQDPPLRLF